MRAVCQLLITSPGSLGWVASTERPKFFFGGLGPAHTPPSPTWICQEERLASTMFYKLTTGGNLFVVGGRAARLESAEKLSFLKFLWDSLNSLTVPVYFLL